MHEQVPMHFGGVAVNEKFMGNPGKNPDAVSSHKYLSIVFAVEEGEGKGTTGAKRSQPQINFFFPGE